MQVLPQPKAPGMAHVPPKVELEIQKKREKRHNPVKHKRPHPPTHPPPRTLKEKERKRASRQKDVRKQRIEYALASQQGLGGGELLLVRARGTNGPEMGHAQVVILARLRIFENQDRFGHGVIALFCDPLDPTRLQGRHLDLVSNELVLLHYTKNAATSKQVANLYGRVI